MNTHNHYTNKHLISFQHVTLKLSPPLFSLLPLPLTYSPLSLYLGIIEVKSEQWSSKDSQYLSILFISPLPLSPLPLSPHSHSSPHSFCISLFINIVFYYQFKGFFSDFPSYFYFLFPLSVPLVTSASGVRP